MGTAQYANTKRWRERHPEQWRAINNAAAKRRILFKGKRTKLPDNPRTGICSQCRTKGLTNIHHDIYDSNDPIAHTRELCVRCHSIQHELAEKGIATRFN